MSAFNVLQGILFMLLTHEIVIASTMYRVFLNSYIHCGHDTAFKVTPQKSYIVTADVSPRTGTKLFRDCETNFYSEREHGQLCLIQEGKLINIEDLNAEMIVHDGYGREDDRVIFNLKPFPDRWEYREYCTETPYINFYLHKVNKSLKADIRKVHISLKVLDIESKDRTLYLSENYCGKNYKLASSQVSVFSHPPENSDISSQVNSTCSISFKKAKNESRSICLVYIPSKQLNCSTDWSITISTDQTSSKPAKLYELSCSDQRSREIHSWCGNNQTHFVSLVFSRSMLTATNSFAESAGMFRYVFADYDGTVEQFQEKVKKDLGLDDSGLGIGAGWIVLIVLAVILVVGIPVIIILYIKRRQLPCVEYKAVHNPRSPKPM